MPTTPIGQEASRAIVRVKVALTLEVDPELWSEVYGPVRQRIDEDVRHYVGGLVAGSEAARSQVIRGVDVSCRKSHPTGDF